MHHNRIATSRLPASLPCPAAIRFVLDDLNSTLSQEERRRLLHVSCLGQRAWRRGAPGTQLAAGVALRGGADFRQDHLSLRAAVMSLLQFHCCRRVWGTTS